MKLSKWAIVETCTTPCKHLRWESMLRDVGGRKKTFFDTRAEAMAAITAMTDAEALEGWELDEMSYWKEEPGHYRLEPKDALHDEDRPITHYRLFPAKCQWDEIL